MRGGFLGVDVFFVISGYVITRSLVRPLETTNRIDLMEFYARRVRRLLPALTTVLVVTCLLGMVFLSPFGPQQSASKTGQAASLFAANFQLLGSPKGYFDLDTTTNVFLHTWSLSIEEQFYFVFPTLLLFGWRVGFQWGRRTYLAVGVLIALVTLVSFAASFAFSFGRGVHVAHAFGGPASAFAFYAPVTRAWEFAIGCGTALFLARRALSRSCARVASAVGLASLAYAALGFSSHDQIPGWVAIVPTVGASLLILGGVDGGGVVTRALSSGGFRWLGDLSYGWYLWHWPMIVFARAAWPDAVWPAIAGALGALILAWLSFRRVEEPLRTNTSLVGRRALALLVTCVSLSVASAWLLRTVAGLEQRSQSAASLQLALTTHVDLDSCPSQLQSVAGRPLCVLGDPNATKTIALVGDSQAHQFAEVVAQTGSRLGYNVIVATRPGCPFVDGSVDVPAQDSNGCRAFVRDTLTTLERLRPALIVIATASTTYIGSDEVGFALDASYTYDGATKVALWRDWTHAVLARLQPTRAPVLLVHMSLEVNRVTLATCPFFRILRDPDSCATSRGRRGRDEMHRRALEAERTAARDVPQTIIYDPTDDLCSADSCALRRDGVWLYRDDGHLSVRGALQLGPRFANLFEQMLSSR